YCIHSKILMVTDQSVKAFAEHCPELQYVGFMGCSVTSKGVIHLTKRPEMKDELSCLFKFPDNWSLLVSYSNNRMYCFNT
ncbi:hypothetical protein STEG23_005818, partial [Scotinomys teguina]